MSLADTQAQAVAVLDALPPAIAQSARQVILELACTAAGKTSSYQPIATKNASGQRPPSSGDPDPPHQVLIRRIADATAAAHVEQAVRYAQEELKTLRKRAAATNVRGESESERYARIVRQGEDWGIHEVASALKVAPADVRRARLRAGRDPLSGRAIRGAESAGDTLTACRSLKRQGLNQTQIAKQLGISQPSVSRLLTRAA